MIFRRIFGRLGSSSLTHSSSLSLWGEGKEEGVIPISYEHLQKLEAYSQKEWAFLFLESQNLIEFLCFLNWQMTRVDLLLITFQSILDKAFKGEL